MRLLGIRPRALFLWDAPVEVVTDHTSVNGMQPIGRGDSRSYRFYPKPSGPVASFSGGSELVISLRPIRDLHDKLKIGTGVRIASVDFTALDDTGRRVSSITADSNLSFPDSPSMREQHVAASEFLEIRNIRRALVRDVQYDAERSALFVSLDGEADNLRTGSRGLSNDFRSNALSRLKNKQPMILLLLFTAWLVSTSIGVVTLARRWGGRTGLLSFPHWRNSK